MPAGSYGVATDAAVAGTNATFSTATYSQKGASDLVVGGASTAIEATNATSGYLLLEATGVDVDSKTVTFSITEYYVDDTGAIGSTTHSELL